MSLLPTIKMCKLWKATRIFIGIDGFVPSKFIIFLYNNAKLYLHILIFHCYFHFH